jgi:hypothetical protein
MIITQSPYYAVMAFIAIIICATVWVVSAQSRSPASILTCYGNDGSIMMEVPMPIPNDFRVQMNGGGVTYAEWTLPVRQKQILMTTMPCMYFMSKPAPGSAGADS